jgi:antitoxin HigA-1
MTMKNNLPPVHPGRFIRRGLDELGISNAEAAVILDCSRAFVGDLIKGERDLSVEMCFKIANLLGSTPDFWARLQTQYDLKLAERNEKIAASARKVRDRFVAYKKAAVA